MASLGGGADAWGGSIVVKSEGRSMVPGIAVGPKCCNSANVA